MDQETAAIIGDIRFQLLQIDHQFMQIYSNLGVLTADQFSAAVAASAAATAALQVSVTVLQGQVTALQAVTPLALDAVAADIQPTGVQAAGSSGLAADARHVHYSAGRYLRNPAFYGPASPVTLTAPSTVMSAISASIITGTFTAPSSGAVMVSVFMTIQATGVLAQCVFGLCEHGTTSPMLADNVIMEPPLNAVLPVHLVFETTGLVAGSSHNFDVMYASSGTVVLSVLALGNTGTAPTGSGPGGPVLITVQAI